MNKFIITFLTIALILSNLWWVYNTIDASVTTTYQNVSLEDNHEALSQALAILPLVAKQNSTSKQIIEAATNVAITKYSFEKDGYIWIGKIGLKFDKNGRFINARPAWDPF